MLPRSALYLSKGTVDQVYLAVRLAVYDLCMKGAPLVLDDALAAFDDQRMAQALDLLLERGEEEQILFFTCHSREKTWLEGRREKQAGNRCVLSVKRGYNAKKDAPFAPKARVGVTQF